MLKRGKIAQINHLVEVCMECGGTYFLKEWLHLQPEIVFSFLDLKYNLFLPEPSFELNISMLVMHILSALHYSKISTTATLKRRNSV